MDTATDSQTLGIPRRGGRPMRVYVAGPLSGGCLMTNIRNAVAAGDALLKVGCVPFVPHLTCFWNMISPHEYEAWMAYDFEWIQVCDAVLRIPGVSPGADREVALAKRLGISVYTRVEDIP